MENDTRFGNSAFEFSLVELHRAREELIMALKVLDAEIMKKSAAHGSKVMTEFPDAAQH